MSHIFLYNKAIHLASNEIDFFSYLKERQTAYQKIHKNNELGVFFTNSLEVVDEIIKEIDFKNILEKKILDPCCGKGIFLLRILFRAYEYYPSEKFIFDLIQNSLYFNDILPEMVEFTKQNIKDYYMYLFKKSYRKIQFFYH